MGLIFLHGENLIIGLVAFYALLILGWTAVCYWLIKFWQDRKKKK
jgi:hypothetical protein